jgi:hypothetical protein
VNNPAQITEDSAGNIFVALASSDGFVEIKPNGEVVKLCINPGFYYPYGIGVDALNNVYLGGAASPNVTKVNAVCSDGFIAKAISKRGILEKRTPTPTPTITPSPTITFSPTPNASSFALAAPNISWDGQPIKFMANLQKAMSLKLELFTLSGEEIFRTSAQGSAGWNTILWELENQSGSSVASGLYIYRLEADDGASVLTHTGKVAIIH